MGGWRRLPGKRTTVKVYMTRAQQEELRVAEQVRAARLKQRPSVSRFVRIATNAYCGGFGRGWEETENIAPLPK